MTTETNQFPCNTRVSVKGVEDVAGNKGPQWKLTCEFPWTGQYPELVWMDTMSDWKPTAGETYDCVVNRRDLKKDKDADTEWNWRHYINSFTPNPVLNHWQQQGYSAPSNQSPPATSEVDKYYDNDGVLHEYPGQRPAPGRTIESLPGAEFGMLYKEAIQECQRIQDTNYIDEETLKDKFMFFLETSIYLKSQPMPTLDPEPIPLQDDEPVWNEPEAAKPPWENDNEPEPTEPQEEMPF